MRIGGIEAGGTKMVCAISDRNGKLVDRVSFPTRQPEETFQDILTYFKKWDIEALGIGCFGPLDLNKKSKNYGYITKTTKPGWDNCDVLGIFKRELNIPIGIDTDVNGAALGEVTWGAGKGLNSVIYITVGTGVGVGVYVNGSLLHGLVHPEAGHMLIGKRADDTVKDACRFHDNCVEALASGTALHKRWGKGAEELTDRPEVWELEAFYLAEAIVNYIVCYSPEKVILWGGVMHEEKLFQMVRVKVKEMLNGYISHSMILEHIDDYIVAPMLGDDPGILGAIRLGVLALEEN